MEQCRHLARRSLLLVQPRYSRQAGVYESLPSAMCHKCPDAPQTLPPCSLAAAWLPTLKLWPTSCPPQPPARRALCALRWACRPARAVWSPTAACWSCLPRRPLTAQQQLQPHLLGLLLHPLRLRSIHWSPMISSCWSSMPRSTSTACRWPPWCAQRSRLARWRAPMPLRWRLWCLAPWPQPLRRR